MKNPRAYLLCLLPLFSSLGFAEYPRSRGLHSPAKIRQLRRDADARAEAEKLREGLGKFLAMSYEELWNFIPPAEQLRAVNVAFQRGCPKCGAKIFREGGHYPWIRSPERPFKVQCPLCKTVFPSNEFQPWTTERGQLKADEGEAFFDDGFGYINEKGEPFYFVAYYVFWQLWRGEIPNAVSGLSRIYLLSGDRDAGKRAVILLARLASVYPHMDYHTQSVHIGKWPSNYAGKICDYIWENSSATTYPRAFDHVRDLLEDEDAGAFLASKGIEDPGTHIYGNLLQEIVQAYFDRNIHGNMGWQQYLMQAALAMNNDDPKLGHTTEEIVDWLLYEEGEIAVLLYNGVTRDGAGSEGSPGYNGMWWTNLYRLARPMADLGYDLWNIPPWAPRLKKMSDYYIDLICAEKYMPTIGDCGSCLSPLKEIQSSRNYRLAYEASGDLRFLRQLRRLGENIDSLVEKLDAPTKEAFLSEKEPILWSPRTRDLGGYGLAVMESGQGEAARAVTLRYGSQGAWHGHKERLTIEYIAKDTNFLPEMGYPAHWGDKAYQWTMGTTSHYTVLVDERGHQGKPPGHLDLLADGSWARVAEASAEDLYPGTVSLYRRTVLMVDTGPSSYLVDLFRVDGGKRHDYSFHSLPWAKLALEGVELGTPREGTVAGEDVPFGPTPKGDSRGNGYSYLSAPRTASPTGGWKAEWRDERDPENPRCLALHVPKGSCQQIFLAQAEPELNPGVPEWMDWLLLRNDAKAKSPASSRYVSVIDPFIDEPTILSVKRLRAKNKKESEQADWIGLEVCHNLGVDLIHSSLRSHKTIKTREGYRFDGRVSVSRIAKDGTRRRMRVEMPLAGNIVSVLHRENAIEISPMIQNAEEILGKVAVVRGKRHETSYTIRTAEDKEGKTRLGFGDVTCIVGILELDQLRGNRFTTKTRLTGYGTKFQAVPLVGLSVVSEDFQTAVPIVERRGDGFLLGEEVSTAQFPDEDEDGRIMLYLSDLSVGETVMIPRIYDGE